MGIFDQGNGMVTCDLQEEEELPGATADNYRPDDSFSGLFNPKTGERVPLEAPAGYVTDVTSWTSPANQPPPGSSQQPNLLNPERPQPASVGLMTTEMVHSNEWKNPHPTYWGSPSPGFVASPDALKKTGASGYAQVPYGVTFSGKDGEPKATYDTLDLNPNRAIEDVNNQTAGAVQMPYAPTLSPEQLLGLSEISDSQYLNAELCSRKDPTPLSHQMQTQLDILMLEEEMLNELLKLSDWLLMPRLNERPNTLGAAAENDMWECINNVYCAVSWGRDREKAEIIRRYFKRLDTTYVRKDGTYYSVVTEGNLAKKVINDLIEVYPWDNLSVLDGYRKNNPKEPVKPKVKVEPKQKPNSLVEAVDELLEAVKKVKDAVR
jgi:hypothetical protein